jgi:hypothetical protein
LNCGFGGKIESSDCYSVKGWAWDKNNPGAALTLELTEGNTLHSTILANTYREDLKINGTGTGNYGFNIAIPTALKDGNPHRLNLRVNNTNYLVIGSPLTLSCPVSQYAGASMGLTAINHGVGLG